MIEAYSLHLIFFLRCKSFPQAGLSIRVFFFDDSESLSKAHELPNKSNIWINKTSFFSDCLKSFLVA